MTAGGGSPGIFGVRFRAKIAKRQRAQRRKSIPFRTRQLNRKRLIVFFPLCSSASLREIVFCSHAEAQRRRVKDLNLLRDRGLSARHGHAGMKRPTEQTPWALFFVLRVLCFFAIFARAARQGRVSATEPGGKIVGRPLRPIFQIGRVHETLLRCRAFRRVHRPPIGPSAFPALACGSRFRSGRASDR